MPVDLNIKLFCWFQIFLCIEEVNMSTLGSNTQHNFYQGQKKWGKALILEKYFWSQWVVRRMFIWYKFKTFLDPTDYFSNIDVFRRVQWMCPITDFFSGLSGYIELIIILLSCYTYLVHLAFIARKYLVALGGGQYFAMTMFFSRWMC